MSNKNLTGAELEATQRIQIHFPRSLRTEVLAFVNSCSVENLTTAIREMLEKLVNDGKTVVTKVLQTLSLDFGMTHEQMIAAGGYDWKNNNITPERFPIVGVGTQEMEYKLFHFDRNISSELADREIVEDAEDNPWESAGTIHILAFGAQNPEEQRKYPIVALNAVGRVDGIRRVVYLGGDGSGRGLRLGRWRVGWDCGCRFLAVRKRKKS